MFKKILAAIDGSEMSHDVFKTALDIAKADKANLLLLHVLSFEEQNSLSIPMPADVVVIYRISHYQMSGRMTNGVNSQQELKIPHEIHTSST